MKILTKTIFFRPWGTECQFTVERDDKTHFNGAIALDKDQAISAKSLDIKITEVYPKLDLPPVPVEKETYTKSEVVDLLVSKGYIAPTQSIDSLKTKAELIAVAPVVKAVS